MTQPKKKQQQESVEKRWMRSVENCGRYDAVPRACEREEREETHEKTASFISFTNLLFIGLILWAAIETLLALVSPWFFFWVRSSFILIFYVKYSDFLGCSGYSGINLETT